MKITKVISKNTSITKDNITEFIPNTPSPLELMKILAKNKISLACVIKDKYDRTLLITSFGTGQISKSYIAENLDFFDGGLVSFGLYDSYPIFMNESEWNFDLIINYEVELIISGEKMVGYHLLDGITYEHSTAIQTKDDDLFELEKYKAESDIYIPVFEFIKESEI